MKKKIVIEWFCINSNCKIHKKVVVSDILFLNDEMVHPFELPLYFCIQCGGQLYHIQK